MRNLLKDCYNLIIRRKRKASGLLIINDGYDNLGPETKDDGAVMGGELQGYAEQTSRPPDVLVLSSLMQSIEEATYSPSELYAMCEEARVRLERARIGFELAQTERMQAFDELMLLTERILQAEMRQATR